MNSSILSSSGRDRQSFRSNRYAHWPVVTINSITHVVTKGTTPTTYGMPFTDEGVNFIKAEALNGDSALDRRGFRYINHETHTRLSRSILRENDVLVTIAGANVGRCGFVRSNDLPANTNQAVGIVRVNPQRANPIFVYYFFKLPSTRSLCLSIGGQAAQPNVNLTNLKAFEVLLPSRSEQTRVADILSAYDDLIENNRRRIALLEQAARELYREWFVRLRFPGHESARVVDGLPKGWETKTLGEVADIRGGKQFGGEDLDDSHEYPVFGGNGIQGYSSKSTHSGFVIVFGRVGVNCGSIHWSYDGGWVNNNASSIVPRYFNELVLQHLLHYNFSHFRKGAAQPFIPNGLLSTVRFVIPRKELSVQYCNLVLGIRIQQTNLHQQTRDLARARDLLLPRLMSGEVPG